MSDICDKSKVFVLDLSHLSEKEIYSSGSVLAEFIFEVQQGLFSKKRAHSKSISKDCMVKSINITSLGKGQSLREVFKK